MMKHFVTVSATLLYISVIIFGSYIPRPGNSIYEYCYNISVKWDPVQEIIFKRTLELQNGKMIGAPEVLQLGQNLIHLIKAEKVIDIGTFTGSSAVAWALAMLKKGEVLTIDINPAYYNSINYGLIETRPDIYSKIKRHVGPAMQKLDAMLASGEAGKWDFIFIDADKINYPWYYDQSVDLLRPGGIILIDNALWGGKVLKRFRDVRDRGTAAIHATNQKASKDSRVHNYLMSTADGIHMIFKKDLKKDIQNKF